MSENNSFLKGEKHMKFLIPTHLQNIYHLDMDKSEPDFLTGRIKCTCGCVSFQIRHNHDETPFECTAENLAKIFERITDPDEVCYSMMVRAECMDCGKDLLLLDAAVHGYDGFVCHDGTSAPDSELKTRICPTCGKAHFAVTMTIEPEDYEQFQEEVVTEYPDEFKPSDFVDAFNWMTISLRCTHCGHSDNGWIDMELS